VLTIVVARVLHRNIWWPWSF